MGSLRTHMFVRADVRAGLKMPKSPVAIFLRHFPRGARQPVLRGLLASPRWRRCGRLHARRARRALRLMRDPRRRNLRVVARTLDGRRVCALLLACWLAWTALRLVTKVPPAPVRAVRARVLPRAAMFLQPPAPDDAVSRAWRRNEILVDTFDTR
jgi:hypothetical protein